MVIMTVLASKPTFMAIVTTLAIEAVMAIVTILALKPTFIFPELNRVLNARNSFQSRFFSLNY